MSALQNSFEALRAIVVDFSVRIWNRLLEIFQSISMTTLEWRYNMLIALSLILLCTTISSATYGTLMLADAIYTMLKKRYASFTPASAMDNEASEQALWRIIPQTSGIERCYIVAVVLTLGFFLFAKMTYIYALIEFLENTQYVIMNIQIIERRMAMNETGQSEEQQPEANVQQPVENIATRPNHFSPRRLNPSTSTSTTASAERQSPATNYPDERVARESGDPVQPPPKPYPRLRGRARLTSRERH